MKTYLHIYYNFIVISHPRDTTKYLKTIG